MSSAVGVSILIISDSAARHVTQDRSGPTLTTILAEHAGGKLFKVIETRIVADEEDQIASVVKLWSERDDVDWIITSGGTGLGQRDRTPEAIAPLIDRSLPGLIHLLMSSSIKHTPLAALSRPVAGTVGSTLLVTLPGSPKAVKENMAALLDAGIIPHAIELIKGGSGSQVHRDLGVHDRQKISLGLPTTVALVQEEQSVQHGHHRHHHHHHHHEHDIPTPKSHDPFLGAAARHRVSPYALVSLDDALAMVQRECKSLEVITKKVDSGLRGFVLARDVIAPRALPSSATTNVDGYAVRSSPFPGEYSVLTAQTHSLSTGVPIPDGHAYRINTGAPLPQGTNAVVMVEDTELKSFTTASDGTVEEEAVNVLVGIRPGENVRASGSDVRQDEVVLESGTVLGSLSGEVGTLTFIGRTEVDVYRKPVVAIMSTGNEIVDLHADISVQAPSIGNASDTVPERWAGIYDTNRPSLQIALEGLGYEVIDLGIVEDDIVAHTKTMKAGLQRADVLLTTGGSSMGSSDLLKPVIERHLGGTIHFGRVNVKPGKPTTFATAEDSKPIFALPGNPASALVMFHIFVVPALRKLGGWPLQACHLPRVRVKLLEDMYLDSRPEFHRVQVRVSGEGLVASSTGGQRSSRVASLAGANGLVALPGRDPKGGKDSLMKGDMADAVLIGEIQVTHVQ